MNKEKLRINNSVLYKRKTIEITGDIIVPDIKPDIINQAVRKSELFLATFV